MYYPIVCGQNTHDADREILNTSVHLSDITAHQSGFTPTFKTTVFQKNLRVLFYF